MRRNAQITTLDIDSQGQLPALVPSPVLPTSPSALHQTRLRAIGGPFDLAPPLSLTLPIAIAAPCSPPRAIVVTVGPDMSITPSSASSVNPKRRFCKSCGDAWPPGPYTQARTSIMAILMNLEDRQVFDADVTVGGATFDHCPCLFASGTSPTTRSRSSTQTLIGIPIHS